MGTAILDSIQEAVRAGAYDMTAHAFDEAAEDGLELPDIESAVLSGEITRVDRDDPRGPRYVVRGYGADRATEIAVVGRFTTTNRYLIITVYAVTES